MEAVIGRFQRNHASEKPVSELEHTSVMPSTSGAGSEARMSSVHSSLLNGDDVILGPIDALLSLLSTQQAKHEERVERLLAQQAHSLLGRVSSIIDLSTDSVGCADGAGGGRSAPADKDSDVSAAAASRIRASSTRVAWTSSSLGSGAAAPSCPGGSVFGTCGRSGGTGKQEKDASTSPVKFSLSKSVNFAAMHRAAGRSWSTLHEDEGAIRVCPEGSEWSPPSPPVRLRSTKAVAMLRPRRSSSASSMQASAKAPKASPGLFFKCRSLRPQIRHKSWTLEEDVEKDEVQSLMAPSLRRAMRHMANDRRFEVSVAMLIVLNAALLGYQADSGIRNLSSPEPQWFSISEYFFAVAFTLELLLRLFDEAGSFFRPSNKNIWWNVFDLFVVISSWSEDICRLLLHDKYADISTISVLRLLRLVRMLRLLRVMRFCRELRDMIQGILASLRPLLWCLLLLSLVIFSFGTCVVQMAKQSMQDQPEKDYTDLMLFFGGMLPTLYTLYAAITGGMDWSDAALLLGDVHFVLQGMFCLYIAFAVLCVLNIVTGVFVDKAKTITGRDAENMISEQMAQQEKLLQDLRKIFAQMAGDSRARLPKRAFLKFAKQRKVQAYLSSIGLRLQHGNAQAIFNLIDQDDDGEITSEEFVRGCMQLIGGAQQLDLARLRQESGNALRLAQETARALRSASNLPGAAGAPGAVTGLRLPGTGGFTGTASGPAARSGAFTSSFSTHLGPLAAVGLGAQEPPGFIPSINAAAADAGGGLGVLVDTADDGDGDDPHVGDADDEADEEAAADDGDGGVTLVCTATRRLGAASGVRPVE